ncbi:class I SAM-dependent methyltransferase [Vallitalea guaymasensis]|uniref:class I SAM-dependent methyltransferase n=1 Tax=Vallitalea guaymasensis TaxID=1185412 RepID=UPI00272A6256|nr:class I SAM-dependent methyltransferase [Vallitalea guaymasensis]
MKQYLKDVPETLLIPLWARAAESKIDNPIVVDDKALKMMEQIDYDFTKFEGSWMTQTGVAVRTEILDREVRAFINKYQDATIINFGCGLDTRYFRVDNGQICWYDIDLPEPIRLRRKFFEETNRHKMIGKSVFDFTWIDDIHKTGPILIIAEGILMYFTEQQIRELMNKLLEHFPGANMLLEVMTPLIAKNGKKHETVNKTGATFKWGIKSGKEMEKIDRKIKFVDEWNYYDYHKNRWKGLRLLILIPFFKKNFNNRIVHIKI